MNQETAIFFFCRVLCAPKRSLLVRGVHWKLRVPILQPSGFFKGQGP